MFEVAEDAAGRKHRKDLLIKRSLARMCQVMNGKARNHSIEAAAERQRLVEVVRDNGNAMLGSEEFAERFNHGRRKIECNIFAAGPRCFDKREQSSSAAAKIENACGIGG